MPRFDFAISFAGTERPLARRLAENLSRAGFRVFFDEHFEHEMLGRDGVDYLNTVFFEQSRYCVALVSEAYERRSWTQLERRAAQAKEHLEGVGSLLPVLVDKAKPEWLLPTRVYFDLTDRTLSDLVDVLRRKHSAEDATTFQESGRVDLPKTDRPLFISAGWEAEDFFVWCTSADHGQRQAVRLFRHLGSWITEEIPITRPSRWMFRGESETVVGVPDTGSSDISIFHREGRVLKTVVPPRHYRWNSATDAKERLGQVLIGYCGGDTWLLNPSTGAMRELRSGTDDVQYTYVDFWNENIVVALEERREIEVRSTSDGQLLSEILSPVAAEGLFCFPEADLIVIIGLESVATIRMSSGKVVSTEELVGQGAFSHMRAVDSPLLGFISGLPVPGNALEIFDARGSRRLLRRRASGSHWSSVAVATSGRIVAATTGSTVVLHERRS